MNIKLESIDRKTGEVDVLEPINSFDDLERLIQDALMDRVKTYEAQALLAGARIRCARRKLALQDGLFNAYADNLDFAEDSKYWKSTFESKKVRDQLCAENPEYATQSKELDEIQALLGCIEVTTDFIKAVQWSSWGRKQPS